jgi:hypothetical protein
MPSETHRHTSDVSTDDIAELLWSLVEDTELESPEAEDRSLVEFGVDAVGLLDLWEAVCEEFGERSLGQEFDPTVFESTMTVRAAAGVMAILLTRQAANS